MKVAAIVLSALIVLSLLLSKAALAQSSAWRATVSLNAITGEIADLQRIANPAAKK